MTKLITTTPVGKNGQTVVPAKIRKMFKLHSKFTRVGWFVHDDRIEIAPIEETKAEYSIGELAKLEKLVHAKGGKVFKSSKAAKDYLKNI